MVLFVCCIVRVVFSSSSSSSYSNYCIGFVLILILVFDGYNSNSSSCLIPILISLAQVSNGCRKTDYCVSRRFSQCFWEGFGCTAKILKKSISPALCRPGASVHLPSV